MILRISSILIVVALASGCANREVAGLAPVNNNYCDNFLVYDMCARDSNRDGVVDFVYFADTEDIFMYRKGMEERFPGDFDVHPCAIAMDESLVDTTSRLFFLEEDSSFLERQDIRGAMMVKYIAYMPEVTACNIRAEEAEQSAEAGDVSS